VAFEEMDVGESLSFVVMEGLFFFEHDANGLFVCTKS